MRRTVYAAILSCIIAILFSASNTEAKLRIAVMDFENKAPGAYWGWRLGHGASDMLATSLVKTKKFSVLEREKLSAIMQEQNLGRTGAVTNQTAARVGRLLGVQYIVTGAVTEFGKSEIGGGIFGKFGGSMVTWKSAVDIRLVDTSTGEIIFADMAESSKRGGKGYIKSVHGGENYNHKKATEVMRGAIDKLSQLIADELGGSGSASGSWSGAIAKISGKDKIYINGGSNVGLKKGQKLVVIQRGEAIIDPETGLELDSEDEEVGILTITKVKQKVAICKTSKGGGFKVGDRVIPKK